MSGGALGQEPTPSSAAFQITVTTQGRFDSVEQFENVIVRSAGDGRLVHVRDVARVEIGAQDYFTNAYLNNTPAVAMTIFQRPGSNALTAATNIISTMERLKNRFHRG